MEQLIIGVPLSNLWQLLSPLPSGNHRLGTCRTIKGSASSQSKGATCSLHLSCNWLSSKFQWALLIYISLTEPTMQGTVVLREGKKQWPSNTEKPHLCRAIVLFFRNKPKLRRFIFEKLRWISNGLGSLVSCAKVYQPHQQIRVCYREPRNGGRDLKISLMVLCWGEAEARTLVTRCLAGRLEGWPSTKC